MHIERIVIPTRPQPDTLVGIFLLKTFGKEEFPGIANAPVEVQSSVTGSFEELLEEGTLPIDVGGGPFDHHNSGSCVSEIISRRYKIANDPALGHMLKYAARDDKEGRGTLSKDSVDRAFGLSGLIASLNKVYPEDPNRIAEIVLPILDAQYRAAREHHVELPRIVAEKKAAGLYAEEVVKQGTKLLKVTFVVSDKPSMPGFLRSSQGPKADVIVQRSEESAHTCVLTRRESAVDLSVVAALIRMREAEMQNIELPEDASYLMQTGSIPEIPFWYFDPATNSLLNGGPHNKAIEPSHIDFEDMKRLVRTGLASV
jgi:hypothetical protein